MFKFHININLRIDAARHMWPDDLEIIFGRVRDLNTTFGFPTAARAYQYHEVIDLGQ
jgi:alpha-amylase